MTATATADDILNSLDSTDATSRLMAADALRDAGRAKEADALADLQNEVRLVGGHAVAWYDAELDYLDSVQCSESYRDGNTSVYAGADHDTRQDCRIAKLLAGTGVRPVKVAEHILRSNVYILEGGDKAQRRLARKRLGEAGYEFATWRVNGGPSVRGWA